MTDQPQYHLVMMIIEAVDVCKKIQFSKSDLMQIFGSHLQRKRKRGGVQVCG